MARAVEFPRRRIWLTHTRVCARREWIAKSLRFGHQHDINLFETTIRILGGLLSAFAMTKDNLYLDKSKGALDDAHLLPPAHLGALTRGTRRARRRHAHGF
jgi:hypothetical protein